VKIKQKHWDLWKQYLFYTQFRIPVENLETHKTALQQFFVVESHGLTLDVENNYQYGDKVSACDYLYLAARNGKQWLGWHIKEWSGPEHYLPIGELREDKGLILTVADFDAIHKQRLKTFSEELKRLYGS
jgi:hypothetical protein